MNKETEELLTELNMAKTQEEIENFYLQNEEFLCYPDVTSYLAHLFEVHNLKKVDVVRATGLDRAFAYHLLSGKKVFTREKILIFAIAANFTVVETQTLLKYGKFGKLYARDKRDCAIIYALNQRLGIVKTNEFLHDLNLQGFVLGK